MPQLLIQIPPKTFEGQYAKEPYRGGGSWSYQEKRKHVLELIAVKFAIQAFISQNNPLTNRQYDSGRGCVGGGPQVFAIQALVSQNNPLTNKQHDRGRAVGEWGASGC